MGHTTQRGAGHRSKERGRPALMMKREKDAIKREKRDKENRELRRTARGRR